MWHSAFGKGGHTDHENHMGDPLLRNLESAILRVCETHPPGLTDAELVRKLDGDVKPQLRIKAYNKLLKDGRLRLAERFKGTGAQRKKEVLYQWVSDQDAVKFRGLDASDRMVYDLIQRAGQNGVTKRDMKIRTNIQNNSELKQIVERLTTRGLVKEIKSVQGANKRVYIISELEPSTTHTGGAWYNDEQEFDNEFIDAIYSQVLKFAKTIAFVTVEQVTSYVAELKISNETLSQQDIGTLMWTMTYDGTLEECEGHGDGKEYFRKAQAASAVNQLSVVPCGKCPVFHDCVPGGVISPQNCVYMTEWLKEVELDW